MKKHVQQESMRTNLSETVVGVLTAQNEIQRKEVQYIKTDRTYLCHTVAITEAEVEEMITVDYQENSQAISKALLDLQSRLKAIVDKPFVLMKNKDVCFARNVAALFPRMDKHDMPAYRCSEQQNLQSFTGYTQDGYTFQMMTPQEFGRTFAHNADNPFLDSNGQLKNLGLANKRNYCITDDFVRVGYSNCCRWYNTSDGSNLGNSCDRSCCWTANLIPIYRFCGKDAQPVSFTAGIRLWVEEELIPEDLDGKLEKAYVEFMKEYKKLKPYLQMDEDVLGFNHEKFMQDVLSGTVTDTIYGYSFNLKNSVILQKQNALAITKEVKEKLLQCDWKRANIAPYAEKQLTDINLGHWELFEEMVTPSPQQTVVELPEPEVLVARPPQLDVRLNGTCGIDFGTKSTVVVCRNRDERLLRVGKGDYTKAPVMADYENPTVIELRDIEGFRAAYAARNGRPYTEWEELTVSHQAADAIFTSMADSSVFYAVFSELKQWANDKKRRLMLRDRQGNTISLDPYLELQEGDFDPIEIYAYYLGLYINNMHNGIYLQYILSFPVNYSREVQDKLLQSFTCGLRKSLPPAILADKTIMEQFDVYAGASEPAAYAISALKAFGLEPKKAGEVVYYGVFDFGGGTTDFDFGMERIPDNHRYKFEIDQFGSGGDVYLGGENILDLLAFEVYKDNLDTMRKEKITFVLPPQGHLFAGSETLVFDRHDASQLAFMNSERLAGLLRPIWERHPDYTKKYETGDIAVRLFSSEVRADGENMVDVNIRIDVPKLEACIEKRIQEGVDNFFVSLKAAFVDKEAPTIHIFLAGNSSKSPVVKKLFDEHIAVLQKEYHDEILADTGQNKNTLQAWVLHLPLGMEPEESASENALTQDKVELNQVETQSAHIAYDQLLTGKTGVAFGLMRSRIGGRDVKINNHNRHEDGEIVFPYFLGEIDGAGFFHVVIGQQSGYGKWLPFTYGDERFFELYYTREPQALEGKLLASDVNMIRCLLTPEEISDAEDVRVYICKVAPDKIEYAVGKEGDFQSERINLKKHTIQLES